MTHLSKFEVCDLFVLRQQYCLLVKIELLPKWPELTLHTVTSPGYVTKGSDFV